jgi:SNF2 family DNA or RNA helicase
VAKQLALAGYYLDIDDDIELPTVYDARPKIYFKLTKEDNIVAMEGKLVYGEDVYLPLSVIRLHVNLIYHEAGNGEKAWFYIPTSVFNEVFEFINRLPSPQYTRLEQFSQLTFESALSIDLLKKAIFELSNENWNIELSDNLKKDFIYKVHLQAEIQTRSKDEINWFEYDVVYKYKDFSFTHKELKKFFQSKQKFMTLDDGRIIFFENKDVFNQMESMLGRSESTKDKVYKMSMESVPYFFKMVNNNPAIKLYGDKYMERMSQDLITGKLKDAPQVPAFLSPIMRSYQKSGYQWLKMLEHYHLNGILADEMGLGKTIQAISILSDIPAGKKCVIICPKTLIYNWAEEFKKFKLNKAFIIYEGNKPDRMEILEKVNFEILIASYSIIQNDIKELADYEFEYVILDEAQHIKNVSALRTKAIKKLNSKHRLALTGTPLENDISEIWSLFDFLLPNYLMSRQRFIKAFGGTENKTQREDLNKMISPFILRRKKIDVLIELPNKQEQVAFCKMSPLQEKVYMQLIEDVNKSYFNPQEEDKINYINILTALMRLRQICDHPHLVEADMKDDIELSGKVALMQELILDAIDSGRKILVFSQFIGMLKIAVKMLKNHNIPYEYLDGKTKNRQQHIDNFNNNTNIKVFLISLKTGGYGLNLTSADTVILADPWWNPMIENQAIDRAHRIGQTKKVQVYKLIAKGTVEEKILSLQNSKKELFEQIIENNDNILKSMSVDQIKELFHYEK